MMGMHEILDHAFPKKEIPLKFEVPLALPSGEHLTLMLTALPSDAVKLELFDTRGQVLAEGKELAKHLLIAVNTLRSESWGLLPVVRS